MDLSKFTNKSKSTPTQSQGFLNKNYNKLKYWVLPPTSDKRKERISQYKNIGIFITSILIISTFEDKIKNFLEIETDDLRKMTAPSGF